MDGIRLKVAEAAGQHVGKGVAVVHSASAGTYGWAAGQILEVSHNKKTYVKFWPGSSLDQDDIRIDGITRYNAGAGIGDRVLVRQVDAAEAEQVALAPAEPAEAAELAVYAKPDCLDRVVAAGDSVVVGSRMGGPVRFVVTATRPAGPVVVTGRTVFKIGDAPGPEGQSVPQVTYDELGGLGGAVQKIREMVELPIRHPELFEKIGIEPPKGVLLHGPPGTGKTLLAKAVAGETNSHFVFLSGPEIVGRYYGESEERIRDVFKKAEENAPSIVFIDEIDSIAPKREEVTGEVEKRIVSQLLTLMDGMKGRGKVTVIAATNRPDSIDPALRRPGRFDREIEIGIPDEVGRREILDIHTRGMPLEGEDNLAAVARVTHGFVGADLAALAKEAAMWSLRRMIPKIDLDSGKIPDDILGKIRVSPQDFREALKEVRPSALREVLVQVPDVSWDDVGGLDAVKEELREAVEWPLRHAEAFRHADVRAPKGILLHGPPGTGKTLLAKATAKTTESNFISIKGPELLSKWVGESEKGVREIFRKARQAAPCIVFFDEIESLVPRRGGDSTRVTDNVVSQILAEIDGLEELHNVLVMGATNRLDMIDRALLRPGRFDRVIEVPAPDRGAREKILEIHTRRKPLAEGADLAAIAEGSDGLSGAAVAEIANTAAREALRRHIASGSGELGRIRISQNDLEGALAAVREEPAS